MSSKLVEMVHALDEDARVAFYRESFEKETVLSIIKIVKSLETAWDIEAVPNFGNMLPPAEEAEEVEQTEFEVVLTEISGSSKIKVIKAVRDGSGKSLTLKEAKAVIDRLPATVGKGLSKLDAESLKKSLEEAGGVAEIK